MEKVLFLGLGAVGATFASQFAGKGYPFRFVCDGKRKEKYGHRVISVGRKGRGICLAAARPTGPGARRTRR